MAQEYTYSITGCPRPEYPRPQFERKEWLNLNGEWEFEQDPGMSGRERKLYEAERFSQTILVPFCPESDLSGVGNKDYMNCVWYRKTIAVPADWKGGRIFLNFGAVDYKAYVYVNGKEVMNHKGGYASFGVDITDYLSKTGGENVIAVCAEDITRSGKQPKGKQSGTYYSRGCDYTRTTGIWQTVWIEHVPDAYITNIRVVPDPENGCVQVTAEVAGAAKAQGTQCCKSAKTAEPACCGAGDGMLRAEAYYEGKPAGCAKGSAASGIVSLNIALSEKHLWEPGAGRLYDLKLTYGEDEVNSYFGLRSVKLDGMKFLINGTSVFQRLVLDQGFYPDGIYTAPTDEALVQDIELSMAAGFNGARLHQKAFEPRFLYHCDRLGYLVWGEHANWGLDLSDYESLAIFLPEWVEIVNRDFNHPAIVGWCPFNETWDTDGRKQRDEVLYNVYTVTKAIDPTRPCIDTSGNFHVKTDIFDVHDYDQNPETFKARYDRLMTEGVLEDRLDNRQTYRGEASFVSEYGGIKWDADGGIESWGYGEGPKSMEEYLERYRLLTDALLDNDQFFGFCYTQLYDVEQEKNGLYTYHRKPKFDMEIIRTINMRKAAIEQ